MGKRILYDSRDPACKRPFGALKTGQDCEMTLRVPSAVCAEKCELTLFKGDMPAGRFSLFPVETEEDYTVYRGGFSVAEPGLYFYRFTVFAKDGTFDLYREGDAQTNIGKGALWQLNVYDRGYVPPELPEGCVFYQIFPDRFNKAGDVDLSEKMCPFRVHASPDETPEYLPGPSGKIENCDFFGGNFKGIEEKLPYLAGLYVKAIYLNPICKAWSNHRYDTADYKKCDPMLGTDADFSALCDRAHALGIRIILDGVFSHTGSRSIYFDEKKEFGTGVMSCPDSPYAGWYRFSGDKTEYDCWWGILTLPCVEENEESYRNYILRGEDCVVAHWLNLGADGFRLDVADELPDSFIAELKRKIREIKPGALLIGEVWEDASNKESYGELRRYLQGQELDSVMNYPFRNAVIDYVKQKNSAAFCAAINTLCENYPAEMLLRCLNFLSTHDTPRIFTVLGGLSFETREQRAKSVIWGDLYEETFTRLRLAVAVLYALPGCPCIYYGDEAGMQGFEDPFNRRFFPWGHEDIRITDFFRLLGKLRQEHPALRHGGCICSADGDSITVRRSFSEETVLFCAAGGRETVCEGTLLLGENAHADGSALRLSPGGFAFILPSVPEG